MNYWSKILKTGAIKETPESVIYKLTKEINKINRVTIIEFGAGKGEITSRVIEKINNNPHKYYAFELDLELGNKLNKEFETVEVILENALNFLDYLPKDTKADYIICSIPMSFYSFRRIKTFLKSIKDSTKENGKVLIVFNAIWLTTIFRKIFKDGRVHYFSTVPVYFLYVHSLDK